MGIEATAKLGQRAPDFEPIPSDLTMGKLRAAIPSHLFERKNSTSLSYLARDILLAIATLWAATCIKAFCETLRNEYPGYGSAVKVLEASAWML